MENAERRDFVEELSREDVRALAGEVLEAVGVEKVEMDGEEREAVRKAVEAWRKGKMGETLESGT